MQFPLGQYTTGHGCITVLLLASVQNGGITDHRMNRCHLKGSEGDALHAVLCAAGYNIRWLLRMIAKKGLGLLLCLLQVSGLASLLEKLAEIFGQTRLQNSAQRWVLA